MHSQYLGFKASPPLGKLRIPGINRIMKVNSPGVLVMSFIAIRNTESATSRSKSRMQDLS